MSEKKKIEPLIKVNLVNFNTFESLKKRSFIIVLILKMLMGWINTELAEKRVIVKDIQEDIYDGQILQMLVGKMNTNRVFKNDMYLMVFPLFTEKLSGVMISTLPGKLNLSEMSKKQNLKSVIDFLNVTMDIHPMMSKWKVESNLTQILTILLYGSYILN